MDNIQDIYELTPMQQGMLYHSLLSSRKVESLQTGAYLDVNGVQTCCTLTASVDVNDFRRAWESVVSRHPILRSAFFWKEIEKPLQIVYKEATLPWTFLDWSDLSEERQGQQLEEFLKADQGNLYDLETPPLFRVALIRLDPYKYRFVLNMHHLILDGWSMSIVLQEVLTLYKGYCQQEEIHLLGVRPYSDYISWLQSRDHYDGEAFWNERLQGYLGKTDLRVRNAYSAQQRSGVEQFETHIVGLQDGLTEQLHRFCRKENLTPNTLVQGAWAALLQRYSGDKEVVFGITVSGRPAELTGMEGMVGLFINTLPMRVGENNAGGVLTWLRQIQQQHIAQEEHASSVRPGQTLFDTLLVYENYPIDGVLQSGDGELLIEDIGVTQFTVYPLTCIVEPEPDLTCRLIYNTSSFEAGTIERMGEHFCQLLTEMVAQPEERVSRLRLMSVDEEQRIVRDWNATEHPFPEELCIHQLFEERVRQMPDAVAVHFEDERLTYSKLNERANQLAHWLHSQGVGAESLVGVCMERSLEMVIALYGILKAGGAYVPLDPDYPVEQLLFMVEDAGVSQLLTQEKMRRLLSDYDGKLLALDSEWAELAQQPATNLTKGHSSTQAAYMLYTSGSTGLPRGVVNTHRALVNRLHWMQRTYQLDESDVVLQKTPYSLDASVWEFFWPLFTGAKLVVARPDGHRDAEYLVLLIEQHGVTTCHFVPSMLRLFLSASELKRCQSLRRVICSGEALSVELQNRFFESLATELHNLYGPTEAAIDVTAWHCQPDPDAQTVPVGYPIDNVQIYILDTEGQPVPIGVPGELHIGGIQIARGYHKRPDLTQERFIRDPFSQSEDARLYKSGDLARYRVDGAIEYLGRMDFQVKLRGFRIELGEIEALLEQHPAVDQSVVLLQSDGLEQQRLIGYWTGVTSVSDRELRTHLQAQLPDYMVPSALVPLDAIPLTTSGIIDRYSLPRFDFTHQGEQVLPRTEEEQILADIWCQVLGLEEVGVHDNFFQVGGDSILAMQIVTRTQDAFDMDFPLHVLFETQTIAQLSDLILTSQLEGISEEELEHLLAEVG